MKVVSQILLSIVIFGFTLTLLVASWYPYVDALRIVFGSLYVLFLPGFVWTFFFFSPKKVTIFERIIYSFALSACLVPLSMLISNTIGIKVNLLNAILIVALVSIFGGITLLIQFIHKTKQIQKQE